MFQSFALFPWRTVLDNVAFGPKMRGVPKARAPRDRARVPRARRPVARGRALSERALGRHAAARRRRPRARQRARRAADGRAVRERRRADADDAAGGADADLGASAARRCCSSPTTSTRRCSSPTASIVLSHGAVLDDIAIDLPRPRAWDALIEDAGVQGARRRACCSRCARHDGGASTHGPDARRRSLDARPHRDRCDHRAVIWKLAPRAASRRPR